MVETSQALSNRVVAQQTSPLGTVSGQTHHDDSDPRVASDREGTLAAADTQLVFSAKSWYQIGTVVSTSASGSIVDTNVLGDDVVYIDHTEFTVSFGALALDLAASSAAGGGVVLLASASVSSKTVSQPVKTLAPKGPLPYGPLGDLYRQLGMPVGPIVVSAGPAITSGAASASGSIAITAPLRASFDQTTRAIELRADLKIFR